MIADLTGKEERVKNVIERKGETGFVIITELIDESDRNKILEKSAVLQKELGIKVEEDLNKEERKRK